MAEVMIFKDMNFGGASQRLGIGRYDTASLTIGSDQISSIKVPPGLKVTLYDDGGFAGASRTFLSDATWVGNDFNDKTSSLLVQPATGFTFLDESSQPGGNYNHNSNYNPWIASTLNNWMSYLSDMEYVKNISIPGTHDSCTAGLPQVGVQTNSWTIQQQLEAGIRFLDIRTRCVGNGFAIHHGAYYLNTTFDDVMNTIRDFLQQQPKEAIIMRLVANAYDAAPGSADFMTIWNSYTKKYDDVFAKVTRQYPNLGSLRGKVFVLADNFTEPLRGTSYNTTTFDIQDLYKVYWTPGEDDYNTNDSRASLPAKVKMVNQYLDKAATSTQWVLNYLCGSTGMTPEDVARATNGAAYDHIGTQWGQRAMGLVVTDFPGESLIYRIIKSNFTSTQLAPAKTFRCQSDHSWVEFRLPEGIEGQIIEIPGGAYNHYVFPKCNRVWWTNLAFLCTSNGWQCTRGNWQADGLCDGSPGNSPYVVVGDM